MRNIRLRKIVFTALCIAIGLVLVQAVKFIPVPYPGAILLPMHIPVLLCGFLCGWRYGALSGVMLPLLGFVFTGMPHIFPTGFSMMFELAAYGSLTAILYQVTKGKIFVSLIGAMLGGRVVYGIIKVILFNFTDSAFGWSIFMSGAFITAMPGIIVQLIIIPPIVLSLQKANLIEKH